MWGMPEILWHLMDAAGLIWPQPMIDVGVVLNKQTGRLVRSKVLAIQKNLSG
jgi:hypothetical protein